MSQEKYTTNNNLKELHASGYEIMDGEPDIRGWKVRTESQEIGKVNELLFDTLSQKVRYLIIDLNGKPLNLLSRDVLIPIGLAELDNANKVVLFPEVTAGHLATLPEYKKGKITIETERAIRTVFVPDQSRGISADTYRQQVFDDQDEFYNHEHFNEDRMYKSRRPLRGSDDTIRDQEYTNTDKRAIPSTGERQNIEERESERRRNAETQPLQSGSFAPFQEGAIEIKEHAEVPVVTKETRVVEEISLNKEVNEHNEKVKDSVRKTEVDVERIRKDDLRD
jgi:hypothetical protein